MRRHFAAFARNSPGTPPIEEGVPGVPPKAEPQTLAEQAFQTAQAEFVSLPCGTPGTPEVFRRCSGVEHDQTPAPQGFDEAGTPGTPGTPQNDNTGGGIQSVELRDDTPSAPSVALPACLSWAQYDALMDAEIAREADPVRRAKLKRQKSKGNVVEIEGRKVYTMGRYH